MIASLILAAKIDREAAARYDALSLRSEERSTQLHYADCAYDSRINAQKNEQKAASLAFNYAA